MTATRPPAVLVLNRGSSSIKRALFTFDEEPRPIQRTSVDADGSAGLVGLLAWIASARREHRLVGLGHRVVHGGQTYDQPQLITDQVREALGRLVSFAPNHLPDELALIDATRQSCPDVPQVACFDTAFHRPLPDVARRLPIPARFDAAGVHAYGFHGLSYTFLMGALERAAGGETARGRIVLAHLGSGSSLAAVRSGRSVDTTMTFTPTGGVVMSTRAGDLDPGLIAYLTRNEQMTTDDVERVLTRESGLLGISGTTGDMRLLLEREDADPEARLAVDIYCYRIRKTIGAYAAALGGLDALVFSGGIGEHASAVRARVCDGLGFLGLEIDAARNDRHAAVISSDHSDVVVRVIPTDEELVIARAAYRLLAPRQTGQP
jgi:acetate kinase